MGRIERKRGYRFENDIAKRYNRYSWRSWRLGASSAGLPDILAVGERAIHVHELKTTTGNSVHIPTHQLVRCADVASAFPRYDGRVVLSARFGRIAEFHYVWLGGEPEPVTINIRGKTSGGALERWTWEELVRGGQS